MSDPKKVMPATEWVLTDLESQRKAIRGMMNLRRLILETLGHKMGGRMLFSAFLIGKQKGLYLQSLIDAAEAMDCEVVVRPKREDKLAARLQVIKRERVKKEAGRAAEVPEDFDDLVGPDDPDREYKLRLLREMKEPANRASLEQVFRELREAENAA